MRDIDVNRGHDLRTMARLLADRSIPGPLYLHDEGEKLAVMIRAQAWDPSLDRFVFLDGRYRCDTCRREGAGFALPAAVPLDVLLKAANMHWQETHGPRRPSSQPAAGLKLDTRHFGRTTPVASAKEAMTAIIGLFGQPLINMGPYRLRRDREVIGWYMPLATNLWYFILKDGRYGGTYSTMRASQDAGLLCHHQAQEEVMAGADSASGPVQQAAVVENLVAAADLLKRTYSTIATTTRNIRLGGVIVGWMACGLGPDWYYVLRDGRHGGPAESSSMCRMAAIERSAGADV